MQDNNSQENNNHFLGYPIIECNEGFVPSVESSILLAQAKNNKALSK